MITQHNQRVLYSDNGVLEDITLKVNNFRDRTYSLAYKTGDYLYIGVDLPFNHKYFDLVTANAIVLQPTIETWDGSEWDLAVDILDETQEGTTNPDASLGQSGTISFKTDEDETGWGCDDTKDIPELNSAIIYNKYWLRISWNANFTTTINHIGQKFCSDDDLYGFYPDLDNQDLRDCFVRTEPEGTKLDWIEQEIQAVEAITREMRARHILWTPNQILDFEILRNAAIHKTAEIILGALGTAYEENRKLASEKYKEAFNLDKFNVDKNANSNLDCGEDKVTVSYLRR